MLSNDPLWYKDAIIYQLHVKAFHDANGDGVGDFTGLMQRLDYIHDLGVTAIWLLPFYPSPLRDDGYDIASYRDVHPAYGDLAGFKAFLDEAAPIKRPEPAGLWPLLFCRFSWYFTLMVDDKIQIPNPKSKKESYY